MKIGLFLAGGGAKGAFQAGVITGLHERGINFDVICGTSIGAINGYFVYTDNIPLLKDMWWNQDGSVQEEMQVDDVVIENKSIVKVLKSLSENNEKDRHMFVNYIHISSGKIIELYDDIAGLPLDEKMLRIRYSALLPRAKESLGDNFTLENAFNIRSFLKDLKTGKYEGMNLDGGVYNNSFMRGFISKKVDYIFAVPFDIDFKIPKELTYLYKPEQICIIKPEIAFGVDDTFRFETDFCREWFNRGYNQAKRVNMDF